MPNSTSSSSLTQLLGTTITDIEGAQVGYVTDFLVNNRDGKIGYVRFRLSIDCGTRIRDLTIPWSTLLPTKQYDGGLQLRVHHAVLRTLVGADPE